MKARMCLLKARWSCYFHPLVAAAAPSGLNFADAKLACAASPEPWRAARGAAYAAPMPATVIRP